MVTFKGHVLTGTRTGHKIFPIGVLTPHFQDVNSRRIEPDLRRCGRGDEIGGSGHQLRLAGSSSTRPD